MPNGSNHPISNQHTLNNNADQNINGPNANGPNANGPGNWTVNRQIDLLKVLALFVAAIGARAKPR